MGMKVDIKKKEERKKYILMILSKEGELSTSRIGHYITSNLYYTEDLLQELLELKKIVKKQQKKGVYWRLS